jgi:putative selenate reductase FAD-binding subunit
MVTDYSRPESLHEALDMFSKESTGSGRAQGESLLLLAGGTYLLSSQFAARKFRLVSIASLLPKGARREGNRLVIGAGMSFQALAESLLVPEALRDAALGMVDRNIRNRATVGGNIGACKSCSSLLPFFLAARARCRVLGAGGCRPGSVPEQKTMELADWISAGTGCNEPGAPPASGGFRGIVEEVEFDMPEGRRFAYGRYSRTSCDLALISCAVAADIVDGTLENCTIAMGGMAPLPRRFPELEALFEGTALPGAGRIEEMALHILTPRGDLRGSADFKRYRAAVLLADTMGALAALDEKDGQP